MKLPQKTAIESEKYTWLYKLKYTFFATLVAILTVLLYGVILGLSNDVAILKTGVISLFVENFNYNSFNTHIFPSILFYIAFEELAFRRSLMISTKNLMITIPLLLFIGFRSFLDESMFLYIYSLYAIVIIFIFKRGYSSLWAQGINIVLSLVVLSIFHLSKFTTDITISLDLFFNHVIPILIVGAILAHLRIKFGSYMSMLSYFLITLLANFL